MTSNHSYKAILTMAWPIILANAAVPLLGLIDTTVIGNLGNTQQVGAIAFGSLIYSFLYWAFGFLRMGTTGFTAQAAGADYQQEIGLILVRALLVSMVLGVLMMLFQRPISALVFFLLDASSLVENYAGSYFSIRIWGAPATLATFALMGTLIGLGKNREVLIIQLFLNGLNAILDLVFAGIFAWGVQGIALGTLISEWATVLFAGAMVFYKIIAPISAKNMPLSWSAVFIRSKLVTMVLVNRDIFIRTVFLIFSFAWFTNRGAQFGDSILAANHILVQFISFSAFFLDGFAFVAEALVGKAIGSKNLTAFDYAVRRSTILAGAAALLLSSTILVAGDYFVAQITDIEEIQLVADSFVVLAAVYILVSFAAFQLDGIFIGAVKAPQMRNASVVSTLVFLALANNLSTNYGNTGLWWAFIIYVIARAATLGFYFPALRRQVSL